MRKKVLALLLAGSMVVASLAACGSNSATTENASAGEDVTAKVEEDAAAGDAGFVENPIFEDEKVDFMNLSAVWFQAVPMENETMNYSAEDADIHIEADISALENDLGYGVGDWVPYLTVDYKIDTPDGKEVVAGTFMEMAASDGPHYGANIKLDPGTYNLTITIHSPEENGYLLHVDDVTGPGGSFDEYFADGNLTFTYEGWYYAPQEW